MSKSIMIICPKIIDLKKLGIFFSQNAKKYKLLIHENNVYFENVDENRNINYVSININEELLNLAISEYCEFDNITSEFKSALITSTFFYVSYNSSVFLLDVLKEFLLGFKEYNNLTWIDNDYAEIIPGQVVLENVFADPFWSLEEYRGKVSD